MNDRDAFDLVAARLKARGTTVVTLEKDGQFIVRNGSGLPIACPTLYEAFLRLPVVYPDNYDELTAEQQWEFDKSIGALDHRVPAAALPHAQDKAFMELVMRLRELEDRLLRLTDNSKD
jgi:hypothetical protein